MSKVLYVSKKGDNVMINEETITCIYCLRDIAVSRFNTEYVIISELLVSSLFL